MCKSTIDAMGRVVIPKQVRKDLRWEEGKELCVTQVGEMVVFGEYSPLELGKAIHNAAEKEPEMIHCSGNMVEVPLKRTSWVGQDGDTFYCGNCNDEVDENEEVCKTCGHTLDWKFRPVGEFKYHNMLRHVAMIYGKEDRISDILEDIGMVHELEPKDYTTMDVVVKILHLEQQMEDQSWMEEWLIEGGHIDA